MQKGCLTILLLFLCSWAFGQVYYSRTGHINVKSVNKVKNIEADNYQVISSIDIATDSIKFEGLLKSFEFKMGALDRVFNSSKVNVNEYPKISYEGVISGLENLNLNEYGEYPVEVKGVLYIWDEKRITSATGTVTSIGDGKQLFAYSGFKMTIEEGSMHKLNQIMQDKLPSVFNLSADSFGIERDINVLLDVSYKLRNW